MGKIGVSLITAIEDDLADVLDALSDLVAEWRTIATKLLLREGAMNTIDVDNRRAESCLRCAITEWLKLNYDYKKNGLPSWRMLAKAVQSIDRSVFNKIAMDHSITGIAQFSI